MGSFLGIAQDFTPAPAHARLNLPGWVTMAIYGLCHRGIGRTGGLAGWVQGGGGTVGAATMAGGLGVYLWNGHDGRFVPLIVAGSLQSVLAMLMFLALVVVDLLRVRSPSAWTQGANSG